MRKTKGGGKDIKERDIQKQILDYLHLRGILAFKHRNVGIYKQSTGKYIPLPFGEKGISDILGCTKEGKFLAIEVKKEGGRPSEEQKIFLSRVSQSGGLGILAYSLDDVTKHL